MIISIAGGLGNQMFQYAYYFSQKKRYPNMNILADLSFFDASKIHNGYELDRIFGISLDLCNEETSVKHRMTNTILDRLLRKCGIYYAGFHYTLRDKAKGFDERFMKAFAEDDYLYGFWQSEKYFKPYKLDIMKKFQFPNYTNSVNIEIADKMKKTLSVAIHIRRGDYLNNRMFVNLSEVGYYKRAIEKIKQLVQGQKYWFVFSDDIEWCKKNLDLDNEIVEYVSGNCGSESYRDMQLMTECKYMIVANSSFSWWAAYLNRDANIIIAPKEYYVNNAGFNRDVCPEEWLRI